MTDIEKEKSKRVELMKIIQNIKDDPFQVAKYIQDIKESIPSKKELEDIRSMSIANSVLPSSLPITTTFINGTRAKNINFPNANVTYQGDTANVDAVASTGVLTPTSGQYKIFVTVGSSNADYITDGVADDVQIQAAINAADEIWIKDGNYDITASLTIPSNKFIWGTKNAILKRNASMTSGILIKNDDTASGNSSIRLSGFKVDGSSNLVTPVDGMESLRFDLCSDVQFYDLEVINSPSEGIQFHRGTNCHVIRCLVNGTAVISASYKAGIIISGNTDPAEQSTDCSIVDCYTENTSGEGVGSYYSQGIKLNRNTIRWTSGSDNKSEILIEQSKDVECLDNTVTSNLDGIICLSSQRVVISGYTIKSATLNGISVEGSSRDITIGPGTINNVQLHGINLQDTARNISIVGPKIVNAGQDADNTYYAINLDPNGGFLRRITITGTHAYASTTNKIKSFIGTTTDVSNQIADLYERGNFSEGNVGAFRTIDNDIYVDFVDNQFINNETGNGLYIEQDGSLAVNKRAFYLNQVSDLQSSARAAHLTYTNAIHTAGYLVEERDDNSSSTLTAVHRIQADGTTGFGALYIDNNNNGRSINVDHDGNNPSAITGLYIDVANAGVGAAYGLIVNAGRTGLIQSSPTAYLHLGAGTATANTAPLKLTSGTSLGTTEAGAIEYDGSHLYFTAANAGTRYQLDQQATAGGLITRSISSISSPTSGGSAANTDYVYFVSGTTTFTLPTAVGNKNRYTLIHTDTSTMTLATTSSQTIAFYPAAPATTATVTVQGTVVELFSDGSNWWTI
jgi:hypothetical protein